MDSGAGMPQQAGVTGVNVPRRGNDTDVIQQTTQVITPRDRVRWGPIWAGLLSALSLFLLGNILLIAIGATTVSAGGDNGQDAGIGTGIASAILGLLCFLFGGWVAARTSAVRGTGNGVFNGFLVWALGTLLALALAGFGLGSLLGAAGDFAGQIGRLGQDAAANVDADQIAQNRRQIADNIQDGALGTFAALGLPALAAAIGGALGARKESDRDVDTY